ncbi:MAG TPA: HlyD family efflux transporter periplasmic adaptor subunit, partial [Thermoanaerobaculia bacterium]|nr:HlyD family efflux transporter periplasmic adaptor subunit [Thermoanaerobaculia bacterium]
EAPKWVAAERRQLDRTVPITGRLRAVRVTDYGPPLISKVWNYKISFMAPEGVDVEAGEMILAFDTADLEERLRRNLAARDTAEETLKKRLQDLGVLMREESLSITEAEARVRRSTLESDLPTEVVARREIEKSAIERELAERELGYRESRKAYLDQRSRAEIGSLEAQRARAAEEVAEIEGRIESMTVRAQRAGVVMYKATGNDGNKKRLGDAAWRGEKVIEIPEFGEMMVDAWVLEADAGSITKNLDAELYLDADPRQILRATVSDLQQTVERRSEQDPRKVVRLELTVTRADPAQVRPGMRVQGSILVERRPPVVAVPVSAVQRGESGPFVTTRRLWRGKERRTVELGRRDGPWVEVKSGLDEGDQVIADPS